jgi:hypothetical protein
MALLFMDSFDHYATADIAEKWTSIGVPESGSTDAPAIGAYGRYSTQGRRTAVTAFNSCGVPLCITAAPSGAVCITGVAAKYTNIGDLMTGTHSGQQISSSSGASNWLFAIRDTNTTQVWFRVNTNGTITALRGDGASCTELGTTTNNLQDGVWAFVEVKVTISNTVGTVDIRINGTSGLSLTGQDTQYTANAQWNEVRLGYVCGNGSPYVTLDNDDFYLCDGSGSFNNDFLGDVTVSALYPSGAGATTGWTPSAGSNYQCVDEALVNDDSDYNSTSTISAKDTYAFANAPSGADIRAVQVVTAQRKSTEGPGTIKHVVRSGGTDYDQAGQGIGGTSYSFLRSILETDPATAAAWTESGFNAAEFGLKKTG